MKFEELLRKSEQKGQKQILELTDHMIKDHINWLF